MASLKIALIIMLVGTTSCLQIWDECTPKRKLEGQMKGSELRIRAWVPKVDETVFLTLMYKTYQMNFSREIEIRKNLTNVKSEDNDFVEKHEHDSVPHGWINFLITSTTRFKVSVPDHNLTLVDTEDVVADSTIKIAGKHVTVNCMSPMVQWEVSASQEIFIPLDNEEENNFTLFSRSPFEPKMKIGVNGLIPLAITSLPNTNLSSEPLPACLIYSFTLKCGWDNKTVSCYIQTDSYQILVGSISVEEFTSISLYACGKNDYIIAQDIYKDQEKKPTSKSQDGAKKEDQKECQEGSITITAIAIISAVLNALLMVYITYMICKKTREEQQLTEGRRDKEKKSMEPQPQQDETTIFISQNGVWDFY